MNETIVNPWIIYLIMESHMISQVVFLVSMMCAVISFQLYQRMRGHYARAYSRTPRNSDEEFIKKDHLKYYKKWYIISAILCVFFVILMIVAFLVPSRETLIMLYLNQFVTPENFDKAMEIINSMKK